MTLCETQTPTVYLSGFSQALNWRPTEFVKRLHRVRVCSLCGVVPSEATVLECSHTFCKTCYDGVVGCGRGCPIDGTSFDETQVTPLKFPESDLLKREVRCWNKHRGCDFLGSLADALNHFHEVCTFHEVKCVRCQKMVRQRDMVDHYTRGCKGERVGEEPGTISLAKDIFKSTKQVEAMLSRLADTQASLQDSLNNLTAETRGSLQDVKESIADQIGRIAQKQKESARSSTMLLEDIRTSMRSVPGAIRHQEWLKKKFSSVFRVSHEEVYWSVDNLNYHIERSKATAEEQVVSEVFLIDGYTVRLSAVFLRDEGDVNVEVYFIICRGLKDEELDWPFTAPFEMSVVHPRDSSKYATKRIEPTDSSFPEAFLRPTTTHNEGIGGVFVAGRKALEEFALNDAILVRLQRS